MGYRRSSRPHRYPGPMPPTTRWPILRLHWHKPRISSPFLLPGSFPTAPLPRTAQEFRPTDRAFGFRGISAPGPLGASGRARTNRWRWYVSPPCKSVFHEPFHDPYGWRCPYVNPFLPLVTEHIDMVRRACGRRTPSPPIRSNLAAPAWNAPFRG